MKKYAIGNQLGKNSFFIFYAERGGQPVMAIATFFKQGASATKKDQVRRPEIFSPHSILALPFGLG